jgi:hypothetical protein
VWTDVEGLEELAYPNLFPTGQWGARNATRPVPLTLNQYGRIRLRSHDQRFAGDPSWIFRMLNFRQREDMASSINFVLRSRGKNTDNLTARQALEIGFGSRSIDPEIALKDFYPTIGQKLRGTGAYWRKARSALHNLYRTLGPPSLFLTANPADLNWFDLFHVINPTRFPLNDLQSLLRLNSEERTAILNQNAGIVVRFIKRKVELLFQYLESHLKPLGSRVVDYFYRYEAQERGTLHVHRRLMA